MKLGYLAMGLALSAMLAMPAVAAKAPPEQKWGPSQAMDNAFGVPFALLKVPAMVFGGQPPEPEKPVRHHRRRH